MAHAAAQNGHLPVVKYLVQHGADVNYPHGFPLINSAKNGHLLVVKYLVEHGVNGTIDHALWLAADHGHLLTVIYLIEHGANIHFDNNIIFLSASQNGRLDVVKYLFESVKAASSDVRVDIADASLHVALLGKQYLVVKYLLVEQEARFFDTIGELKGIEDILRAWKISVPGSKEELHK